MYVGRDMTELSMMSKAEWDDSELAFFHKSFQQALPYLNAEGQALYREIIEEMHNRTSFNRHEATYTQGTSVTFD